MGTPLAPDWLLWIDGALVNRAAARIQLASLVPFGREATPSLSFVVRGGPLPTSDDPYLGLPVELEYDEGDGPTLIFRGQITGADYGFYGGFGWGRSYTAQGLRYLGDLVPVTDANTGGDAIAYNLDADDPEFVASRAGRTVGQILASVLLMRANAEALDGLGIGGYTFAEPDTITLPASTVADLATLTVIPPSAVYVQGEKLLNAIEGVLRSWAPNHLLHVQPDGILRFLDQRLYGSGDSADYPAAITLTMGDASDRLDVGGVQLDHDASACFGRVVVRGGPEVEPMLLSLARGDLEERFEHDGKTNQQAKDDWQLADFGQPGAVGSADSGTCTCPTTLTVEVTSADAAREWAANAWDQTETGRHGYVMLSYSAGAGVTTHVTRRIVSNTALAAAGTSTLTLDRPLPHQDFDSYTITGTAGGGSIVWRRYEIADPDIRRAVQSRFPYPVPFVSASGNAATLTSFGVVRVLYSDTGEPPYFEGPIGYTLDRDAGLIDTERPTVSIFGTLAKLEEGGAETDGIPSDVQAFLPVAIGALTAVCPEDGEDGPEYEGTGHETYGLERTLYVTAPNWRFVGSQASMDAYARELLDSVKDVVIEGTVPLLRFDSRFLRPGRAVNIAGSGFTTGFESAKLPALECRVRWAPGTGAVHHTEVRVSNRRAAFDGAAFSRPEPDGMAPRFGTEGGVFDFGRGEANSDHQGGPPWSRLS